MTMIRFCGLSYSALFITVIIAVLLQDETNGHRFGYSRSNQRRWMRHHGHCAGKFQSPIAIQSNKAIPLLMPGIELVGYHNLLPHPLKLMNNGHTASLNIPKLSDEELEKGEFLPYISGGKLPGDFEIEGIHFHWGDKNNRGSEHVINDIRYTMEMHIVHRNKKYATIGEALEYSDGAAVLGFFFAMDEDEGNQLNTLVKHLPLIPNSEDYVTLNMTFTLSSLLANIDMDKFYTYKGSLTTPPCSEAVTWVLFPDPLPISPFQIARFRHLTDTLDDALVDNFRTLQPIGNRRIFVRKVNTRHTLNNILDNDVHYTKWDWYYTD